MSGPRILAAIVNFNGSAMTDRAITSFLGQDGTAQVRLVVVDNGSRADQVDDLVARIGDRAELVLLSDNLGYAAACNVAARLALETGAEYTWFLNNDLLFPTSTLQELVEYLELHPEVAAVAPVTVDAAEPDTVLGAGVDVRMTIGRVHHRYAGTHVADLPPDPYDVAALEGACLLVRTEALRAIGPLDEGFFMYWEDAEWSMRAHRLGYRLSVIPTARVTHFVAQSSDPRHRVELMIRNRIRFVRRIGSGRDQATFLVYLLLAWLPAFYVARLMPRFGAATASRIVRDTVGWNLADAWRRRAWRLRPPAGWDVPGSSPLDRSTPSIGAADRSLPGSEVIVTGRDA